MLGRFGKDAGSLVGVEIAPDAVRMLQLQQRNRRWRVVGSAQEPLMAPLGDDWVAEPDAVVAALQRAYQRSGLKQRRVALALPASQVICKLCHLPAQQNEAQLEARLLADAERLFPFPLEDLALDFQVLGASSVQPGCSEVMVAACRQSALASLESVVEAAGLQLEAVEVDNIALCRMLPRGGSEGAALLRVDARSLTLYDWLPGRVYQRRELPVSGLETSGLLPEHLQALLTDKNLPAGLWISSSSAIDSGWLQGLGNRLNLPCRCLPGLTGLEHVDGSMLLACALAVGGLRP
ncbi:pilus assembly protein PilM [Pseudomonas putida]|jgi:type IV pilus assembly protein PilM|uniref:Type IV pili biogenesis protein PilM n=1 Tax=Pseudomonas putida (strain GB-1) TaxID=76869 RepID=B0KN37_PSEPG|nr:MULTISPECIES: pilus assembly protein PilM [Pseudomonas]ABZ01018.1 type IV pili biogenesis protein PilM [Pseudomonas putida GB-1]APF01121.1 pilus assembly protein PilM [Pseudomonas putida]MBP0711099.1 pilus assembly protein PilM [Pseudomonas sp. T34]MCE1000305.1 pilus assembly protein PilM [Pseudomonas sp. NMI1173_11]MCK2190550.1 pilus assembly protein PilM [Pseudomonas sp. MB04B]